MNTETKKPTVYEYLDSDVDRYGSCLSIHVFENRYSLGNIAVVLAGDHPRLAVDELLEVHFNAETFEKAAWFPLARDPKSAIKAIEALLEKLKTIEYSQEWVAKIWDFTSAVTAEIPFTADGITYIEYGK